MNTCNFGLLPRQWPAVLALLLAVCGAAGASAQDASTAEGLNISGKLQLQWDQRQANSVGPLALANALQPGIVSTTPSGATWQAELRSSGKGWNATATLQQQTRVGQSDVSRAWFNELAASLDAGGWQYSAGKKIVAWDVGYGFRPNDVVQQEERRSLVSSTAEGRPVVMAEHFDADTAWSWVLVNPTKARSQRGAQEPALAARVYQRQGAVDWHGFARWGAHTAGSAGAALSWVASDALELHASARYARRYDTVAFDPTAATLLAGSTPWHLLTARRATQMLAGGTWTHESQFSVLAEIWHDGTALPAAQWADWRKRNQMLPTLVNAGAPASAVAGNLAWQSDALTASSNLQRNNVFVRLSWEHEGWQPTLDVLYHPADGGRLLTAALLWKGDRVQLQGGLRGSFGPDDAVLMQLPTRRQAYLVGTWSF